MNDITPEPPRNIVAINADAAKDLEIRLRVEKQKLECPGTHIHIEVDSVTRTIICRDCGFVVDPFEYLERWAIEGERRMTGLKGLDAKIRIGHAEYADLQRKIANLRSKLKRAGQPQPLVERQEYRRQKWNAL